MFKDGMKQSDGLTIRAECGHPGVKAGETCTLCGTTLQDDSKEKKYEESSSN